VTSLVMMPDTDPVIDDVALVEFVLRWPARRQSAFFPAAAITKGLEGEEMTEIGMLLDAGAVLLHRRPAHDSNPAVMRNAMRYARDFGAVIAHGDAGRGSVGRRRDERRPVRELAGLFRHSARGRDHAARTRPAAGGADRSRYHAMSIFGA
jgi:dihydroorotase